MADFSLSSASRFQRLVQQSGLPASEVRKLIVDWTSRRCHGKLRGEEVDVLVVVITLPDILNADPLRIERPRKLPRAKLRTRFSACIALTLYHKSSLNLNMPITTPYASQLAKACYIAWIVLSTLVLLPCWTVMHFAGLLPFPKSYTFKESLISRTMQRMENIGKHRGQLQPPY